MNINMAFYQFIPTQGGMERHIFSIAKELKNRNYTVNMITTNLYKLHPANLLAMENCCGIDVIRFKAYMARTWGGKIPISPETLFKSLPSCDLLHIHSINVNLFMLPLQIRGLSKRIPIVITPHMHPDRLSAEYYHTLYKLYFKKIVPVMLKRADAVIALTPSEKQHYEKCGISNVFEVPNGVDLTLHKINSGKLREFIQNHDPEVKKILLVGRVEKSKGLQTIIQSLPYVLKKSRDMMLYIVGPYTEYALQMQFLARKLKCHDKIRFFFNVSDKDLPYFYEISDLIVMPSRQVEAQGIVLLESWAHRKPVLVINRGGPKDLVSQGGGRTVNSFVPYQWGMGISQLINDKHELEKLGNDGYKLVLEKYTWKHVADSIEKVYRYAVESHR